ncbi:MAG: 3-phosphoshikimate 1-carboxyvinyltransferase [Gammaproteobacteria bacterium]
MSSLSTGSTQGDPSARRDWLASPATAVAGELTVPGDKSVSHRTLMLGALAEGVTEASGFLDSEDCLATLAAMRAMGVRVERPGPGQVRVHGVGLHGLRPPAAPLDMGNAGTAMRLSMGLLAGQAFDSVLVGDASLTRRPMERAAAPLRRMGAVITTTRGTPPVTVHGVGGSGRRLRGDVHDLAVASAQVKSALLLAGLYADAPTTVIEHAVTRDHTERMLRAFGAEVFTTVAGPTRTVVLSPPAGLRACRLEVPGDISSAAFFLVAGSIAATGSLLVRNVGLNPTRTGILDILRLMGADLRILNPREAGGEPVADIEVHAARLRGIRVPRELVPLAIDEFPALFIAAACAEGETLVEGAEELRVKESDRIASMEAGLRALGVPCEARPDGMVLAGSVPGSRPFGAGEIDSRGDHRIAMSFAVASLAARGTVRIADTANVATSFPSFLALAGAIGLDLVPA